MTELATRTRDVPAPIKRKPGTPPEIAIKVSWCKGCGLCVDFCNRGVLEMDGAVPRVVNAEKCNRCLLCEAACPDFALDVREPEPQAATPGEAAP
jgi:2-oxoglutarate ferredoxin oxidoreductase subunit delta